MKKIALLGAMIFFSLSSNAADNYEFEVSPNAYNRIVLPTTFTKAVIPPQAELAEPPVSLNDGTGLLVRPVNDAKPIPVFIELETGESFTVILKTNKEKLESGVFRYKNTPDFVEKPANENRPSDGFIGNAIVQAYEGKIPDGFGVVGNPDAILLKVDKRHSTCNCVVELRLNPVKKYRGSQHQISVWRLSSNQLLSIDPRDFWHEGVVAVTVESDITSENNFPLLVVMESIHE